jgi:hypothetical protein
VVVGAPQRHSRKRPAKTQKLSPCLQQRSAVSPPAALLLKRLALIKIVARGNSALLALTDKGRGVLSERKISKGMRAARLGSQ